MAANKPIIKYYLRGTVERNCGRHTWRGEGFSESPVPVPNDRLMTREECRHRAFEVGAAAEFVLTKPKAAVQPTRFPSVRRVAELEYSPAF